MKLLIAVHNLNEKKAHLMPWRTVIEVAMHLNQSGHQVRLISLGNSLNKLDTKVFPTNTNEIRKSLKYFKNDIKSILKNFSPDLIFWPVTWRESKKRTNIVKSLKIPVVGWFPGGVYSFDSVFFVWKKMKLRETLPYFTETLCMILSKIGLLKQPQLDALITMTKTTADTANKTGWCDLKTYIIPPGKDSTSPAIKSCKLNNTFQSWLDERPYFLFMGPPSKIRGIYELISAFEIAADQNRQICLVCLFRSDGVLDQENIKANISNMKHSDRIFCIWNSLPPDELDAYKKECLATVMPFLLVPSEIPLAIIETMAWGKPIITTSPGGTGDFVIPFGAAPKTGDVEELSISMLDFAENEILYQQKCSETIIAYKNHPDWEMMSNKWLEVAENVLSGLE